jgi:hypothetical protein
MDLKPLFENRKSEFVKRCSIYNYPDLVWIEPYRFPIYGFQFTALTDGKKKGWAMKGINRGNRFSFWRGR